MLYLRAACCFFKGGDSVFSCPQAIPELSPLIFLKFQVLIEALMIIRAQKLGPSGFQSQMLRGFVFHTRVPRAWGVCCEGLFPLCSPQHPSHGQLHGSVQLPPVSPFFLHSLMWPLYLAVESLFCQSSGCFLGYLHWCECYLVVSVRQGELSILQLGYLPQKSDMDLTISIYTVHWH